jgi:putative transposase
MSANKGNRYLYHCASSTYRRKAVFFDAVRAKAATLIHEVAADKGYDLVACVVMPDHIHLLLRLDSDELPWAMNMFKGILSRRIFQEYPDLRADMRSNHLWAAGYHARVVDADTVFTVIRYIEDQHHAESG